MKIGFRVVLLALVGSRLGAAGSPASPNYDAIFAPWRTNMGALAPDGLHAAFPVLALDGSDQLAIVAVDDLTQRTDLDLTAFRRGIRMVRVAEVRWVTSNDLVAATTGGVIITVHADGTGLRKLADPIEAAVMVAPSGPRRRAQPQVGAGWSVFDRFPQGADVGDPNLAPVDDSNAAYQADQEPPKARIPRPLRLLPCAPPQPGSVWVQALGWDTVTAHFTIPTTFYRLSLDGKMTVDWNSGRNAGEIMIDRAGRPRLLLADSAKAQESFSYSSGDGKDPIFQPMDQRFDPKLGFALNPDDFADVRSVPLGFSPDGALLYYASNLGRDTFGLYSLDVRTGESGPWKMEEDGIDLNGLEWNPWSSGLIWDRSGALAGVRYTALDPKVAWLDEGLRRLQDGVDAAFPGRFTRIVDWDAKKDRALVLVFSNTDPGSFFLYDQSLDATAELLRRGPDLALLESNQALAVEVPTASGVQITGYLTLPREPHLTPAPLVVICHDGPWIRVEPGYHREAQALAAAGFAVWEPNYRGSSGFGRAFRLALRAGLDQVPLQDVLESVDALAARYPVDRRHVGVYGRGFGGYLALRALQLHPDRVRAAAAIDAPADLVAYRDAPAIEAIRRRWSMETDRANVEATADDWIHDILNPEQDPNSPGGGGTGGPQMQRGALQLLVDRRVMSSAVNRQLYEGLDLKPVPRFDVAAAAFRRFLRGDKGALEKISPLGDPGSIRGPVLLVEDPQDIDAVTGAGRRLRDALRKRKSPVKYQEIPGADVRITPQSAGETVALASDFFNLTLYDFNVKSGRPAPKEPQP